MDEFKELNLDNYTLSRVKRGVENFKIIETAELTLGITNSDYSTWSAEEILNHYPLILPYCEIVNENRCGNQIHVKFNDLPILHLILGKVIEIDFLPSNNWVARIQDDCFER